ncbi:MAG: hypothetical protein HY016_11780 [Nitrosomonadales bacterium]|nr:hypothetical protein [Nitrosomonadales bacterium]
MSSSARIGKFSPWVLVLLGAALAMAAYLQALHYPFVSDDAAYITENNKLSGLHFADLWRLFVEPYNRNAEFLPLRELSYWFDITLFGLNPAAFRVHNMVLYLLCLPLVYAVTSGVWRYFRPADAAGAPWVAAVVAALFALQPSHAEAVVWISGRKDVLSTLFSLLAIWLALNSKRGQGLAAPYAVATLAALLAAMLAKASAFAVAPVIALLWLLFWRDVPAHSRRRSQLLWPLAGLLIAAGVSAIFASIVTSRTPFYFGVEAVTRSLAVLGWLSRLAISPESRHYLYPVFEDPYLPAMVALGVAILAAAAVGAAALWRNRSLEGFLIAVFVLLCIPSIQLIPYQPPSLVSDRWLALAVWPVALLLVTLSWRLKLRPRAALLLVVALCWGYQTVERPRDWRSFETLLDADLRAYPGYYMPAVYKIVGIQLAEGLVRDANETANRISDPAYRDIMLGMIRTYYAVHVDAVRTGNPQEAMSQLRKVFIELQQKPDQTKWNTPINIFWEKRRAVLENEWRFLASSFPGDELVRYHVGLWMLDDHRYRNAVIYLRAAIESQRLPDVVRGSAYRSLGMALLGSGHAAEAEAPLRVALEQSPPDLQAYCSLAELYKQTGRSEEALRAAANCRMTNQ